MTRFRKTRMRLPGYVLLETVIATALLMLGLMVLGAQIQDSVTTVRKMDQRQRAIMLAETLLSELSLGLIEFDSIDDMQEEEFGPRDPSYGYRMILDETIVPDLFHLTTEILYWPREDEEDFFDFDEAEILFTTRTMKVVPRKVNLQEAFGIPDEEFEELSVKLEELGIPGLDPNDFDFSVLGGDKLTFDELVEALPVLMDAFGMNADDFLSQLPPQYRIMLEGLLEEEEDTGSRELIGDDDRGDN
ncbi:MAG: hypothetical protein ACPGXK_16990 [Phycisphaerae bacterium]